jgi:signal transduction histidine kinase
MGQSPAEPRDSARAAEALSGEDEQASLARLMHVIAITVVLGSVIPTVHNAWRGNWGSALSLLLGDVGVAAAIALGRSGHRLAAVRVMVATIQAAAVGLVVFGHDGIHDVAMMMFPATLVVAALLLDQRAYVWTAVATVVAVVAVGAAELSGLIVNRYQHHVHWRNLLDATIVLVVTAIAVWLLSDSLKTSLARARENERRAAAANAELVERVRQLANSEAELRQAQKMEAVGRLASGIAHDFNNVLMVIQASAGVAARDVAADSRVARCIREIDHATEQAAALTRRLLEFTRRREAAPRTVDLGKLVTGLQPLLARIMGDRVRLEIVAPEAPATAEVDPMQTEQVLLNLAMNARDAMPHGGCLRLELGREELEPERAAHVGLRPGRYVRLSVEDTGCGMDEQVRDRVFEPFFTTKADGTGLGLSMVYGAVRGSGGAIQVDSRPGGGTTFRILLPSGGAIG